VERKRSARAEAEHEHDARSDADAVERAPAGGAAVKRARAEAKGASATAQAALEGPGTADDEDDAGADGLSQALAELAAVPELMLEVQRALEPLDEQTEALLHKPLTGVDETDVEILASQRVVLAKRVGEHDQMLVKMRRAAALLERRAAEIEAFAEMAVRSVESAQEDLGLTLARIGSQTEVVSAEDEAAVITAAVLRGEQAGIDALAAIVASAQGLMQQIGGALQRGDDSGAEPSLLMSAEQAAETRSMLRARLEVHGNEATKLGESCFELRERISELEGALDDVQLELSIRRRQITRKNMQVLEHEREQAQLEESKGINANEDTARASTEQQSHVVVGDDSIVQDQNVQLSTMTIDKLERELAKAKAEYTALENIECDRLLSFLSTVSDQMLFGKPESAKSGPPFSQDEIMGSHTYRALDAQVRLMRASRAKESLERKTSCDKYAAAISHFTDASKRDTDLRRDSVRSSNETARLREKLSKALDAAEQAKADRDHLSLKYEFVKLDFGTDAVIELLSECARCFAGATGFLSRESERLKQDRACLDKNEDLLSETWLSVVRERGGAYLSEIETLSKTFGDLESLRTSVIKMKATKSGELEKFSADRAKIKKQLDTVSREADALKSRLDGEIERSSVLESLVDRALEHVTKHRASRNEAIVETEKVRVGLSASREATAKLLRQRKVCIAEAAELTKSIRVLEARTDFTTRALESERVRERELSERVAALRAQIEKETVRPQMSPRKLGVSNETESGSRVKMSREDEIEDLRRKLNCSIVTTQPVEVVLTRCGHLFSRQCVNNLIAGRNRKCPICGERFGQDDAKPIYLD